MKLFVLIVLLCTHIMGVSAQDYHPLLRPNVYWDVAYSAGAPLCYYERIHRYSFEGDTTIDGLTYQKCNYYPAYPVNGGSYFCPPFQVDTSLQLLGAYWREDTVTQQVFRYEFNWLGTEGQEVLVYDFKLSIGDSISNFGSGGVSYLISIDSIQLSDGSYRKRFNFDSSAYIEGIGGYEGLVYPLAIAIGSWSYIMCLRENGESIYGYECEDYYIVDLEKELPSPRLQIYPNPTTDQVHVEYPGQTIQVWLLDLTGKVLDQQMGRDKLEFDLRRYPAGIYLLRILDEKNQVIGSRKIIHSP